MTNYDLCDRGWELYDLWGYWYERHELEGCYREEVLEAKENFINHKENCNKCGILVDYNPT